MKRIARKDIIKRLREQVEKGIPIIGGGGWHGHIC